ncbi:granulocyte colony-stimulating factor receptor-like protein [Labeo rohita]|uniref:Granulocyte colony-stimulating factor receptor-like protein n=1 Tax=Labeo rohita TaxID=84645 RepID=A0A498LSP4_LABRO|nr:granulocyte colony-stimulating factor receptor-like protein [Labeo rohita]
MEDVVGNMSRNAKSQDLRMIQASCAKIHTPAPVVLAGSPVSVSCSFEDDCSLTKGKDFRVVWKIDNHIAPSDLSYQESNRTYVVTIPSLPDTGASIACAICEGNNCQIVNGVKVEAGSPTGSLDTWLKMDDQNVQLYWKPSKNFHANGWNLLYTVESREPEMTLCKTQEHHCFFSLPKKVKTFYLRAINAVGSSDHTLVEMYRIKGQCFVSHFSVHPQSETSLLVKWERLVSPHVTGYVLEWKSLSEKQPAPVSFTLIDKANSSTIITGLKAYKPYNISIYPKYNDWIGCPLTFTAYSSQKVLTTNKTSVVVTDLQPLTKYYAFVTVHTMGGSKNGSVVNWKTGIIDGIDMVLFVIPACVGLTLIIIIVVFACFGKSERVKMCLWPIIPDPANSSIKSWTDTDPLQGMPPFNEAKEPMLVYLSHFSFLDLSENEPFKSDYVKENQWSHDIDSHDESRSSFQTCVRYDTERDRDSVPYATVVFGGPYQNHSSCVPTYVRSESTQPLLGSDDPGSPPPYENVSPSGSVSKVPRFTAFPQNSTGSEENEELWEEFPMLRSLEIRDTDHV